MPSTFQWTQERIDQMLAAWNAGKSAGVIARDFGVTRNVIIGKIHRIEQKLGLRRRDRTRSERLANPGKPRRRPEPTLPQTDGQSHHVTTETLPRPSKLASPRFFIVDPLPAGTAEIGQPCSIVDVTGCRWPIGYNEKIPGRHIFCNAVRISGSPYCEAHRPAPGGMSNPFTLQDINLIRAHWNGGSGLEWLAIKMHRAKNVISAQAGRMGLGRAA